MKRATPEPAKSARTKTHEQRAIEASGAGIWQWQADPEQRLLIHWPGETESEDLHPRLSEENWQLLVSRLHQTLADGTPFSLRLPLSGRHSDHSEIQINGGPVEADETGHSHRSVAGLCWIEQASNTDNAHARLMPLAKLSHELRSPLAAISTSLREARQALRDGPITSMLAEAEGSCLHSQRVIQDMLTAFRAGEPEAAEAPESIDSQSLATQLLAGAADRAEQKGIKLETKLDSRFPQRFMADPVALRRVLQNLLDNAVKYTGDHGQVSLELSVSEGQPANALHFSVMDNGPGLSHQEITRIFEPFERLNKASSDFASAESQGGTSTGSAAGSLGIGLALSQQLASSMSGDIGVVSEPGEGSRFTLSVPWIEVEADDTAHAGTSSLTIKAGTRVLVVDDHQLLSRATAKALTRLGCQVSVAHSATEALSLLESDTPERIILDLDLPDRSGWDLCRELRQRHELSQCRLIAYSGSDELLDRESAQKAGFDGFLLKPAAAEALLQA